MATGFSFGAKPATSTPNTGFAFGTSTPGFGAPAQNPGSTSFGFGTPTANTGLTFGTPASTAASTGLAFKPPASTGLSFATPASTGLSFGTPASTGLSFGTPISSTGLSFGTPAASTGLTFGTSTSAPSTGLGFGASTSAPSTGLSFGAPASAPSTGLSFGAPASTPSTSFSFGATTSAPTLGLSFGATSTAAPSLSFGASTATTGLSFGTATTGLGGLGSLGTSSTGLNLTSTATTTTQSIGLGGIASTQSKPGTNSSTQKELPPKEQPLPNEFSQLVEQFKNIVQEEKNRSSDVARCSVKEFRKVESELDSLNHQLNQVENQLLNNRSLAEQLKYDTAKGLQNIEMAQRTQDTPPSLQYDNTAPLQFFLELADTFEKELQTLKLKIDNTEKFVKKCSEPNVLTSQDLALGLKRLHETFVALAGRMQSIHSQVETQKEVFLSLRKQAIKDNVNPFEKMDKNMEAMHTIMKNALRATPPNLASGPTPFNTIALGSNNLAIASQQAQPPFPTTTTSLGFGLGNTAPTFGTSAANTSMFKPTGFGASPFQLNTSSNFQLQKPPTGNKRGKQ
ncbi:nuclear pore complex protein Nup58 isoform X2 [Tribolium madens]|uniref:nuclear pore complex protein Nup58 isoform X2 n=1 Tax=Tribolium madens TaxID=41895 RepID=UPI001CF73602|nr:nuclear pore complex protein Nup58 isoform X2 [Tribolium madens]